MRTAHDCGLDEAKSAFFEEGFAVVYGREHAVGKDKSRPDAKVCQVWTDSWLKRDGRWQIIASHDHRVECNWPENTSQPARIKLATLGYAGVNAAQPREHC